MGRGGGANRKGGQKRRSKMRVVSHYRKLCNENIAAVLREHQHEPREHPQQIQELERQVREWKHLALNFSTRLHNGATYHNFIP